MNGITDTLKTSIITYCSAIGADPLLTQGAGGNVSWKDGNTLWVKASGTWLAEAAEKDIFVSVDLQHLRAAIKDSDFSVVPKLRAKSTLLPSIETTLHALMPHKVVVHLHAIEILAHLIHDDCQSTFTSLLNPMINWTMVDYHKPGATLAAAVNTALIQKPTVDVVFLKNHGVVIGGADVTKISQILSMIISDLSTAPIHASSKLPSGLNLLDQYTPIQDNEIHQLALNANLFNQLTSNWALYPDHIVFLGAQAYAYKTWKSFLEENKSTEWPELVFVHEAGVFAKPSFHTEAKRAQLRCYYDILIRQANNSLIRTLTNLQISELLNWDAEQYRIGLAK